MSVVAWSRSAQTGNLAQMVRSFAVIGFLKGKNAIAIARLSGKERNFTGEHFWARGYAVSTVGFELEQVRQYIREQDTADGTAGQF